MSGTELRRTTRWAALAVLAGLSLVATACGDSSSEERVAKIGVIAPLDGGLVQFGQGMRNSVQLAVDEANRRNAVPGWRLEVAAEDDSSDPAVGQAVARRLAGDPAVIGIVGTYNSGVAAQFSRQATEAGIRVPVMGGDGIKDDAYITQAGPASDGDLASTVGAPLASLGSAKPFADAYAAAAFAEPASDYGVYAYDATNIIVAAAARVLNGVDSVTDRVRSDIVAAVQGTDTTGASGRVAFDEFGDTRTKVLTLYRVSAGAWQPTKTEAVS